ncbi:MAG: hypothetical protein P4L46_25460 [Fimbriimonas sp.]|nr:hypothetical protein [Fimbriimonas sp.]
MKQAVLNLASSLRDEEAERCRSLLTASMTLDGAIQRAFGQVVNVSSDYILFEQADWLESDDLPNGYLELVTLRNQIRKHMTSASDLAEVQLNRIIHASRGILACLEITAKLELTKYESGLKQAQDDYDQAVQEAIKKAKSTEFEDELIMLIPSGLVALFIGLASGFALYGLAYFLTRVDLSVTNMSLLGAVFVTVSLVYFSLAAIIRAERYRRASVANRMEGDRLAKESRLIFEKRRSELIAQREIHSKEFQSQHNSSESAALAAESALVEIRPILDQSRLIVRETTGLRGG